MGECQNTPLCPPGPWPVDTPGGRFYAEWDTGAPETRDGQLTFFFQFLSAGGRWKEFLARCPLQYTGNRGSGAAKVMGTVLLSVLDGHWRYAHIHSVRGNELKNPWGWGGFTLSKLEPSRLMANLGALIYNWWSRYVHSFC